MNRPLTILAFLALGLGAAHAQDAVPAAPAAPAPAEITVNPAANTSAPSKQTTMLTGFYATRAIMELCDIKVEAPIVEGMTVDQKRLELSLKMDQPSAEKAYAAVKADVEKTSPDCAPASNDRVGVDAVLAIYADKLAKAATPTAPAPAATPAPAAIPAPAEPAPAPAN